MVFNTNSDEEAVSSNPATDVLNTSQWFARSDCCSVLHPSRLTATAAVACEALRLGLLVQQPTANSISRTGRPTLRAV
jgi:hypothetical protein